MQPLMTLHFEADYDSPDSDVTLGKPGQNDVARLHLTRSHPTLSILCSLQEADRVEAFLTYLDSLSSHASTLAELVRATTSRRTVETAK